MTELAFVLAERQNSFFVEIVAALRDELEQLGVASSVHTGAFPPLEDDRVYVLVPPHEWWSLRGHTDPPSSAQLRRTVALCAEQPGTQFFEDDTALAPLLGGLLDVSSGSVAEFERRGVRGVRHAPLGWTRTWERGDIAGARDTDILHLGVYSQRRGAVLAENAEALARRNCRLVLGDHDRPSSSPKANYLVGDEKWRALTASRVLLNIHVGDRPYFEWHRVVQAICNGAVVVSESSIGIEPLVDGEHLVIGPADALGALASELLDDESRRLAIARAAYDLLRERLPLSRSAQTLADSAERALKASRRPRLREPRLAQELLTRPGSEVPEEPEPGQPPKRWAPLPARPRINVLSDDPSAIERVGVQDGVELVAGSDDSDLVLRLQDGWGFFDGGLLQLAEALRNDPAAAFAHGLTLIDGDPPHLANYYPWRIDRADDDSLLQGGWLWRRAAVDGSPSFHSVHVPQFVSRFTAPQP